MIPEKGSSRSYPGKQITTVEINRLPSVCICQYPSAAIVKFHLKNNIKITK
ncbi:hypothetical protein KIS4809_1888 [Bacillus sp. ZZV12-4809]|nr:hypothetical protein KIS4809_1888 [Bacillus sp. ZZV12-4809]